MVGRRPLRKKGRVMMMKKKKTRMSRLGRVGRLRRRAGGLACGGDVCPLLVAVLDPSFLLLTTTMMMPIAMTMIMI